MTIVDPDSVNTTPNWQLLYQDDDILVVNKPSGMLSVPGKIPEPSLFDLVNAQFPFSRIVHRLDMQTSGIILFARHAAAQTALMKQFEAKTTSKSYIALVANRLPGDFGTIDLPLLCDWPNRPKQHVTPDGKPSVTHWRFIHDFPHHTSNLLRKRADEFAQANEENTSQIARSPESGILDPEILDPGIAETGTLGIGEDETWVSRVELTPITGRSHQLRVHLASLGHPILGDKFYAPAQVQNLCDRLCLHAQTLGFDHPITKERMLFHQPADF